MSTETILSRMMNEPTFAEAVFADAAKALAEYNLSAEEVAKFKGISRSDFETFISASPEERKSMTVAPMVESMQTMKKAWKDSADSL